MTFAEIVEHVRTHATSKRDQGTRFERLMQAYLRTTPMANDLFAQVYMWSEFPYRDRLGGQDTGIDLVGLTAEGDWWAIQCKCYEPMHAIQKAATSSTSC